MADSGVVHTLSRGMPYVVYIVTNSRNGKVYVGKTQNVARRWSAHVADATAKRDRCPLLARAIRKYGADSFRIDIAARFDTEADAIEDERRRIAKLRSTDLSRGYNVLPGADGPRHHVISPETRAKLSAAAKRTKNFTGHTHTPEARALFAELGRQRAEAPGGRERFAEMARGNTTRRGKTHSPETRALLAERSRGNKNSLGRIVSEETRAKLSESHRGHSPSKETRAKLAAATRAYHERRRAQHVG